MNQAQLYRELSRRTGDSISEIARLGFELVERAKSPRKIDWDEVELRRNIQLGPLSRS